MRVVIEDAVFRSPGSHLELMAFFHFALEGIHRIEVDVDGNNCRAWLAQRSPEDREECMLAVRTSQSLETREPSQWVIRADTISRSNWRTAPPHVTVSDALTILRKPFCVLLEDEESDRHFLLCMATAEERTFLLDMEKRNGLTFGHGGGLPNMERRVRAEKNEHPHARLRLWLLFDSDALRPSTPSAQSRSLQKCCGRQIEHHQLERRSIENYLPRRALALWAVSRPEEKVGRNAKMKAFVGMNLMQRSHFNMKSGFQDDHQRDPGAGDLYDNLTAEDRKVLNAGFGTRIAQLFANGHVTESALRDDGGWQEVNTVVKKLVALIR
jgi:hypothetical protein